MLRGRGGARCCHKRQQDLKDHLSCMRVVPGASLGRHIPGDLCSWGGARLHQPPHPCPHLVPNRGLKLWVLHSFMDGPAPVCLQSEATLGVQRPQTWVSLTPVPGPGSLLCYLTWWSLSFHICEWANRACASKPACEDGGISEMHKGGPHWSSAPLAYPLTPQR